MIMLQNRNLTEIIIVNAMFLSNFACFFVYFKTKLFPESETITVTTMY